MYKVFIDSLVVYFLKNRQQIKNIFVEETEIVEVQKSDFNVVLIKISDLKRQNIDKLVFVCQDLDLLWDFFVSKYQKRIAAGGLVFNKKDEWLMIFRNDKWDLPKGHLEKNETIEECAIREVKEECGISELEIIKAITITYHTYEYKGIQVLKENHWYLMTSDGTEQLIPQIEEGITKVEWQDAKLLKESLKNTYGSILDVFESIALID